MVESESPMHFTGVQFKNDVDEVHLNNLKMWHFKSH